MMINALSDLARFHLMRNNIQNTKQDIGRLTQEMTTGQAADIQSAKPNKLRALIGFDHKIASNKAFQTVIQDGQHYLDQIEHVSEKLSNTTQSLFDQTALMLSSTDSSQLSLMGQSAKEAIEDMIGTLNHSVAGHFVMAGADSATRPVMSLEDMMMEISSQLTATMTADEVQTTVDDWFQSQGFLLSDTTQGRNFTMGEGVELSVPSAASDRGFAQALGAAFKFVLANDETIGLSQETRVALAQDGALDLQTAQNDITHFRGRQGVLQERLEDQKNHLLGETAAYEIMRNEITEVDQYDAAVRLQSAQDQLDMLFTLTARMSRLSLTEHL